MCEHSQLNTSLQPGITCERTVAPHTTVTPPRRVGALGGAGRSLAVATPLPRGPMATYRTRSRAKDDAADGTSNSAEARSPVSKRHRGGGDENEGARANAPAAHNAQHTEDQRPALMQPQRGDEGCDDDPMSP